jgi:DNA-binding MarR family transcriptional regulator
VRTNNRKSMRYGKRVAPKILNPLTALPGVWKSHVLLFNISNQIINERLAEEMKRDGLKVTPREAWVLMAAAERALFQSEIADCLNINTNVMVRVVDSLQQQGLIQRDRTQNRRLNMLEVTPRGHRVLNDMYAGWERRTAAIFHPITAAEVKRTSLLARQIIEDHYLQKQKGPARRLTP